MSGKKKRLEWDDSEVFAINTKPTRNTSVPYESVEKALRCKLPESKFFKLLDGDWKFNWVKKPALRPVDFYKPEFDVSSWKTIKVPSNWEFQGYDIPIYTNFVYHIH